ncbi:hypothetical protein OSB04_004231 [Centaurea solstitialis]|uniref:Purple acid phosphatase n=1 Tax=Centaurea solstitialis TaxID=347529 RepID=A0AA38WU71_9ASTR|nr:hypothetical protein OSB04_004231 [Centaurea solstitialis]
MDISLPPYQNTSLLQTTSYQERHLLYGSHLLNKPKRTTHLSRVTCSFVKQGGLRPKPKPKPVKDGHDVVKKEAQQNVSSSSGICGQIEKLVLCKRYRDALEMFEILEIESYDDQVGKSTYDALVDACISLRSIRGVKRVFGYMVNSGFEPDLYLRNRMLLMHVKCGMMIDARMVFDEMPERNLVSWNTIMAGLVDSRAYEDAFRLFLTMWEEESEASSRTFATMMRASAGMGMISPGQQLHACAIKMDVDQDIFVSCALIDMYSKCGSIEDAQCVFDVMPQKTTVGWNSIIAGYALHGYSEEALDLYYEMQDSGVKMDHFTFSMIVRVCTRLGSLEHAKQAHAGLVRNGFGMDIVANTALVDFYSKWGRIEDARNLFEKMPHKNVISWNALIAGYGNHGQGIEALALFNRMINENMTPNHVTFLAILSACSYSGLSDQGWEIFEAMGTDFNVKPRAMHYACMIELLGHEGLLDEAFALIRDAPFKPTVNMWAALLTACRVHKNLELGKFAAEKIYGMEPEKLSNYVVLLNIYNSCGKREEAASVFQTLKKKGLRMLPACTWIDVKKQQHMFLSGDKSKSQGQIVRNLKKLMSEIVEYGYVPKKSSLLPDVDEREEQMSLYHSEKLAVSFGLINTADSTPLHLVQSHRICDDCHLAVKLIAKATGRVIVVRDASRFHRFADGKCSCGDYWSCVIVELEVIWVCHARAFAHVEGLDPKYPHPPTTEHPLSKIAIHKAVNALGDLSYIIASPLLLGDKGEDTAWVHVELRSVSQETMIGLEFSHQQSSSNVYLTSNCYYESSDLRVTPYICAAPIKYSFPIESNPVYPTTGRASLMFQIINQRADFSFGLFTGGLESPKLIATSSPISFANPKAPLYPRLAHGKSWNKMTVTWTSGYNVHEAIPFVEWGWEGSESPSVSPAGTLTFSRRSMCGAPASTVGWRDPGFIHTSFLKDLWPNTMYNYRMGHRLLNGSTVWSKMYSFKSSPYPGQDSLQRVIIFGDMGKAERDGSNDYANYQPGSLLTADQLSSDLDNFDIVFHIGNLANAKGYISLWDQFTAQIEPIASKKPYMVASGNNERDFPNSGSFYLTPDSGGECGVPAQTMFYVPSKNRAKFWYKTDYGMFRFCIADSEQDWREGSEQYAWIEKCFASADRQKQPWLIFAANRVLGYSSSKQYAKEGSFEEPMGREHLQKLWQKYKVDIAFYGHVHGYERTCPIYQNQCVNKEKFKYSGPVNGTIHVVVGGAGGKLSDFSEINTDWSLYKDRDWGFVKLTAFNHSSLLFEYKKSRDGKVYDSFAISRDYKDVLACVHDGCATSTVAT